jgi:cold-inducible RNA-binding protein
MGTRLFIGNLSYNVTEQELREAFTGEGIEVRSVRVALDRETTRPRGFAFVETMTDDGAKASIEKLSGRILQGRPIIVE